MRIHPGRRDSAFEASQQTLERLYQPATATDRNGAFAQRAQGEETATVKIPLGGNSRANLPAAAKLSL
jgi:hypothetical protein